ncbi:hypothetical protein GCM10027280_56530 [Micromonospora polyrhachis]|uniref:NhaP-type Na+/H+ or K+/H+ antiporter n=1 Tax=Micromonospora polyrhachis TaxID=1282883 RepID=A0A7W7SNF7_9ACTN|nr:hypothetical protein [Micromonospora polyrhachis]MBB4957999.1 hypothetical protein [Micromonospora polyrhachis]
MAGTPETYRTGVGWWRSGWWRPGGSKPLLPPRVAEVVWPAARRMLLFLTVLVGGWLVARIGGLTGIHREPGYLLVATVLLAVGLFASTYGIDLRAARGNIRLVVVAVSLGVVVKALLISGVLYLAFHRPEYLVLGVAVAQIDPLSFAAARLQSRMSERAKAILSAWASFDDPITILLTVYVSAWVLPMLDPIGGQVGQPEPNGIAVFGLSIAQNLIFAVVACGLWWLTELPGRRVGRSGEVDAPGDGPLRNDGWRWRGGWGRVRLALQLLLLVGLVSFAVWQFLLLGLAITGLFYRPPIERLLNRLTQAAFLLATFALGLVLVGGIRLAPGIVLGVAAFAAHALVAAVIGARLPRPDRIDLLLGQQNGITAIILALLLEPSFPGTVAVVAPAVVTINLLHAVSNGIREALRRPTAPSVATGQAGPSMPLIAIGTTGLTGTTVPTGTTGPTSPTGSAGSGEGREDGVPDP